MSQETVANTEQISLHDVYSQLGGTAVRKATVSVPKSVRYDARYRFQAEEPIDVSIASEGEGVMLLLRQEQGTAHISHSYSLRRDPTAQSMVYEQRAFGDYDSEGESHAIRSHALLDHILDELDARLIADEMTLGARELATTSA